MRTQRFGSYTVLLLFAIPKSNLDILKEQLLEAEKLLVKAGEKPTLWKNIKSLLPGSEQSQIKEITEKLGNTAQLISLSVGIQQTKQLIKVPTISQSKKIKYDEAIFSDTLVQNTLDLATLKEDLELKACPGILINSN